jgi:NAD(P) transhydrogenase
MPVSLTFDLIVIGSGPAGQKSALAAAKLGKRVALVDRGQMMGGVCIHTGTIPSKAMREAVADLVHCRAVAGMLRGGGGGDFGSLSKPGQFTMDDLLFRCHEVIRTERDVIRDQMARNNVFVFDGQASFLDAHTLRVTRTELEDTGPAAAVSPAGALHGSATDIRGQFIMIACGTVPARPASVPFVTGRVIDSDELLHLRRLPKSMIVVGGGVIGTEYASMFAAIGVRVTLIDSRPRLLEFIDDELGECLQFRLRDRGVRLRLGDSVQQIELDPGSPQANADGGGNDADDSAPLRLGAGGDVEARLASGKRVRAEVLLYTIGRQGATATLNLPAAGLTADDRGRLKVNEFYQTAVPHIYASGDVIGFPALAATSMEQGRLASCHMFKCMAAAPNGLFPYGIYTIPEISMVGQTEQGLSAEKTPYEVGIARYREIARGQLVGDPNGMLKLLFHPESRRLLGVHAIGTGATELIHIGQAVMAAGMPVDYFVESIFNYPTLAECYKVAALDGINRLRQPSHAPVVADAAEAACDQEKTRAIA